MPGGLADSLGVTMARQGRRLIAGAALWAALSWWSTSRVDQRECYLSAVWTSTGWQYGPQVCFEDPPGASPPHVDRRRGPVFEAPELVLPVAYLEATAYCACPVCCGQWADGRTAAGTWATQGRTAAADWALYPAGTCLDVPGVGRLTVEDTGSAIRGPRLDVYHATHEDALRFGRQLVAVVDCLRGGE